MTTTETFKSTASPEEKACCSAECYAKSAAGYLSAAFWIRQNPDLRLSLMTWALRDLKNAVAELETIGIIAEAPPQD